MGGSGTLTTLSIVLFMSLCGCEFVDTYTFEVQNTSNRPVEVTFSKNGIDSAVIVVGENPMTVFSEEGGPHGWAYHVSDDGPHDNLPEILESFHVRWVGGPASNKDYLLEGSWWFRDGTFRACVTDAEFD